MRICDIFWIAPLVAITVANTETVLADTKVLPAIGRTYKIAERDALEEVREYAAKADRESAKARLRERILN